MLNEGQKALSACHFLLKEGNNNHVKQAFTFSVISFEKGPFAKVK